MDKWGVRKHQRIPGHGDTPTFHAEITFNGKKTGTAMNDGHGGPDSFYFGSRAVHDGFMEDCRKWAEQFGYPDMLEPESAWLRWYVTARPYGQTADVHVREMKDEMDRALGRLQPRGGDRDDTQG